eukprot:scaffold2663_cov256-Pinguiococcus_pyrenoidosus.AAC.6
MSARAGRLAQKASTDRWRDIHLRPPSARRALPRHLRTSPDSPRCRSGARQVARLEGRCVSPRAFARSRPKLRPLGTSAARWAAADERASQAFCAADPRGLAPLVHRRLCIEQGPQALASRSEASNSEPSARSRSRGGRRRRDRPRLPHRRKLHPPPALCCSSQVPIGLRTDSPSYVGNLQSGQPLQRHLARTQVR